MKKQYVKRTVIMALALMLMMSAMVMSASAADRLEGTLGGYRAVGSVSLKNTYAIAHTYCDSKCEWLYAQVTLYYKFDVTAYCSTATASTTGLSTMASAERKKFGAELFGAVGVHKINYDGAHFWIPPEKTQTGKILPDAIMI